ncbi:cyclopropane fatty acyl phospholipid synthase [Saprospiraceae bacterium]|nr:cyclopropane fatty acyl phospholipid synthase [Saprospiraceae bacterium]
MSQAKKKIHELVALTDIEINGPKPWDLQVNNERFYNRVLSSGPLGLGESYMDGDWDVEAMDVMFDKVLRADIESHIQPLKMIIPVAKAWVLNRQSRTKAFQIGEKHYDIGNDLYKRMLDKRLTYTCGYWRDAKTLDEAQEAKLDLVCRKIGLKAGQTVLDIGCGWGSFAGYAAEKYGAKVTGITVSKEQISLATEKYKDLDVEFRYQDYRDVNEKFDHIVSIGMFEHVGSKYYKTYFDVVNRCLKDDGLFLLHTIGTNHTKTAIDPWTDKYIFPGGVLPTLAQVANASEHSLYLRDLENFGGYYDLTLVEWYKNFEKSWPDLEGYSDRFFRMWRFFLLSAAGGFRANRNTLWQFVYSKRGFSSIYNSVR